jgi:hypothetical protein
LGEVGEIVGGTGAVQQQQKRAAGLVELHPGMAHIDDAIGIARLIARQAATDGALARGAGAGKAVHVMLNERGAHHRGERLQQALRAVGERQQFLEVSGRG